MAITRRPVRDRPDAIPLSIVDLAPWGSDPIEASPHAPVEPIQQADSDAYLDQTSTAQSGTSRATRRGRGRRSSPGTRPASRVRNPKPDVPPSTDTGAALSRAFSALASRSHTVRDMDARLGRAGFAPEAVDGAVTRLQDLGYLNDATFADAWVATRRANRLHGTMRLRHDLARHGVDAATIDVAIADDGNEEARATAVAARAVASFAGTDRATATRRLAGHLARRGFPAGVVSRVVRAALEGWGKGTPVDHDPTEDDELTGAG